jgi:hypothetical protein
MRNVGGTWSGTTGIIASHHTSIVYVIPITRNQFNELYQ